MCMMCDGASRDEQRSLIRDKIQQVGWVVTGVEHRSARPGWLYTVGLVDGFGHPELVVAGRPTAEAYPLLNRLALAVKEGTRLDRCDAVQLDGVRFGVVAVHPAQIDHGLLAVWFEQYDVAQAPVPHALQVLVPRGGSSADQQAGQPRLDVASPLFAHPVARRADRRQARRPAKRAGRRRT